MEIAAVAAMGLASHRKAGERRISETSTMLLMEEILKQLRLVSYPINYKVLHIPGGAGFLKYQQYEPNKLFFL